MIRDDSGNAYFLQKKLNDGLRELVADFDGDYFVTAVFNRDVSVEGAWRSMQHWCNCMNRKLYGKKWRKVDTNDRVHFIAMAEHLNSNVHWHMVLKTGTGRKAWKFRLFAEYYWRKHNQSGSMDVQKILAAQGQEKVGFYVTKETWKAENYDNFRLSA